MPLYNFATYADYREEWTIEARDLDEARRKIGTDPNGDWLDQAIHIDGDMVERRHDFYTGADGETPEIEEITPDHWAYRNAYRAYLDRALKQNIAAIAGAFHGKSVALPRFLASVPLVRFIVWLAPKVMPFDVETYFKYHFSKVGDQTRQLLEANLRQAATLGLPHAALDELHTALIKARGDA